MKPIAVLVAVLAVVAIVCAAPDRDAQTLRLDVNVEPHSYNYAVETSDGKTVQEQGVVKNLGTDDEAISVQGSYSYVGDDGVTYQVNYIADENGFQPQGAHIPVA